MAPEWPTVGERTDERNAVGTRGGCLATIEKNEPLNYGHGYDMRSPENTL